jgi:hypothetical protein
VTRRTSPLPLWQPGRQRPAYSLKFGPRLACDHRKSQIEALHRVRDHRRDHESGEPFVIGRHYVPWRLRDRSIADRILVGLQVSAPELVVVDVVH